MMCIPASPTLDITNLVNDLLRLNQVEVKLAIAKYDLVDADNDRDRFQLERDSLQVHVLELENHYNGLQSSSAAARRDIT